MKIRFLLSLFGISLLSSACAADEDLEIKDVLSGDDWVVLSPIIVGETSESVYAAKKTDLQNAKKIDPEKDLLLNEYSFSAIKESILGHLKSKKRPNLEDIRVQKISLNRVESEEQSLSNRWFYVVTFALVYDGLAVEGSEEVMYLLPDGSIIPVIKGKIS